MPGGHGGATDVLLKTSVLAALTQAAGLSQGGVRVSIGAIVSGRMHVVRGENVG